MSAPGNDLLSEIENGGGLFTKLGVYLRSYLIPTVQQRGLPGQVYATPPDKPGDSSLQDLKTLVGQQNPVNSAYVGTNNSGQIVAAATPTSGITQITGDVNAGPGSGSQAATVVATHLTAPLPVNQGGSGTATPSLVAGSNVTISGSWPNQTVAAAASGMANPMTTVGDLIVGGTVTGGVAAPARLAAGTAGLVLTSNGPGAAPSYQPGGGGGGGVGLYSGSSDPNGYAHIQSVAGAGGDGTGNTVTLGVVGTGNLIVVGFHSQNDSSGWTITDTIGTVYTRAVGLNSGLDSAYLAIFYGIAPANASSLTITAGGLSGWQGGIASIFSGVNGVVDTTASATNTGNNPSVSFTTTNAVDLLWSYVATFQSGSFFTAGPGWTLAASETDNPCDAAQYRFVTSAGLYTANMGVSNTGNNPIIAAAFTITPTPTPGVDGDFYIATSTRTFYGPRSSGVYPKFGSLNAP